MSMYHTDPPPEYHEFLHGPIPRQKHVFVICPGCGNSFLAWSSNYGVMCCPTCDTRLIHKLAKTVS